MKRLTLGIATVALWAAAFQSDVSAQEARLSPGTDIRLLVAPDRDVRGDFVEWVGDTIRLQDPGSGFVHAVPTFEIERLRVSQPRTSGKGALRGLLIGSIAGALSLGAVTAVAGANDDFAGPGFDFLFGAILGGGLGGPLGLAVGATSPGEHWVDVPLEP
jgi:hypothetical protein